MTPRWYVIHTRARHEKKVSRVLSDRGIETYLPLYTRLRQWKDRARPVDLVMFPSYTFARFDLEERLPVVSVPGFVGLIEHAGRPVPLPEDEIGNVRRMASALSRTEDEPQEAAVPQRGTRVLITAGPFASVEGVVEGPRGSGRVVIGLSAIGRGLCVNVDARALSIVSDS
jgi:transcriptional antiterminator RfaH